MSNAGDGVALAAGPLLVASQTRDPVLVSMAVLSSWLPNLLFSLPAGAVADRMDRRRVIIAVNLLRAAVLAALAFTIVSGTVNIALVLAALFTLGTAETFADVASSSLLPRLVPRADLGIANSRMQGSFLLTNQLLTPPIGAFLFVVGMALPFGANAAAFVLGALLVSRVVLTARPDSDEEPSPRKHIVADMVDGFRWLLAHPPMRTLALTIFAFNVTFGAAWSVLVLYAQDRLGMDAVGYGLVTTAIAVGGLIGVVTYGRLERRFSLANIMRVGLLIETFTHLALALTTSQQVALAVLVVFGAHAFIWGTTSMTIRQRAVPAALMGRVGSVNLLGVYGGLVVGAGIGGLLAQRYGLTAPFWFAFVGSAVFVVLIWRQLRHIAHTDEQPAPAPAG